MNDTEQLEQKNEKVTIRRAKWKLCMGVILTLLGFAVLLAGALLDVQHTWQVFALIAGFFACDIVGLILIIKALPGLALSDIDKIDKKYGKYELTQLYGMKKYEVKQTLLSHKFQYDDRGYYRRKKFSLLKDSVSYYVKILDSSNMEKTIRNERNYFDREFQHGKSTCLILMIYSNESTDQDTHLLRNAGMVQIADNMVLDMYSSKTILVVGVDPVTGVGRYLDIGKGHNLYLYKYGCKMLQKLF